jgi:hypothetical protein
VKTDMGNTGAVTHGMEAAPTTIEDCINGVLYRVRQVPSPELAHSNTIPQIDNGTRETLSGTFVSYDDMEMLW